MLYRLPADLTAKDLPTSVGRYPVGPSGRSVIRIEHWIRDEGAYGTVTRVSHADTSLSPRVPLGVRRVIGNVDRVIGRDEETGMSPWAYRAKRVSFAEAKNLIDHDTEEMIQHRKNPDT